MAELRIGRVTHYYSRLGVAVLNLEETLYRGDLIHFTGRTTNLKDTVESMEIDHHKVEAANRGDDVAVKVSAKVRDGDKVYRQLATVASA